MANFKFAFPLQREDLTRPSEDGYTVHEVFSIRELKTKIKECELKVRQTGSDVLLSGGFDVCYSVLMHFNKDLPPELKEATLKMTEMALHDVERRVDHALTQGSQSHDLIFFTLHLIIIPEMTPLPFSEKQAWLNKLKMGTFLLCQQVELLESHDASASDALVCRGRGRKMTVQDTNKAFWDADTKLEAITHLYRMLQLNLPLLFDPPVVEEDFVNAIAGCLFRLLENPSIALQKNKEVRASILQVLGTLNSRYGYSLSCRLKIVQSLRHFEHLATTLSEAVALFTVEYGSTSLVLEVVRDISQIDPSELARDTSATRTYAGFLADLAERLPEKMKQSLSLLMVHLEGEAYTMRKCVLSIIGEIIGSAFRGENDVVDEAAKESRDQLFECLEDHIHDVNAFVRSGVLQVSFTKENMSNEIRVIFGSQIWSKLCSANAIPLKRQQRLLQLVIGRLHDKSSNVRKQAVQLLTTLLQCNPFAASMQVEELSSQLKQEQEKLAAMLPENEKESIIREKEWIDIEKEVVKELEDREQAEDDDDDEKVWEHATKNEVLLRIQHLLKKRKYSRVRTLLQSARGHFEEEEDIFGDGTPEGDHLALKAIFLSCFDPEVSSTQETHDESEKQKIVVAYMDDCVRFVEQMNVALPTVCTLLGSKAQSDVLEAIRFFVSAFQFGVVKAMMGVRHMLALVWSRETTIKDAVVNAYKKLYIEGEESNAKHIVKNFIALVEGATIGELASLEELIGMLVTSKDIGKDCFQVLWQHFTQFHGATTDAESRSAVVLLSMIGNAEPSVISSNLNLLVNHGLSERGLKDFQLAADTCEAIAKMAGGAQSVQEPPLKLDQDHPLFPCIRTLLTEGIKDLDQANYVPMSQKAVSVIYQLAENPDVFAGEILRTICVDMKQDPNSVKLRRLVSFVGPLAVCQLNHLDVNVLNELKRRKHLRDSRKEAQQAKRRRKSSMGGRRKSRHGGEEGDEMEAIGAEAERDSASVVAPWNWVKCCHNT